ncbi:MAG TPA: hypothetical protein VGG33_07650 [Polyangia bacterium]
MADETKTEEQLIAEAADARGASGAPAMVQDTAADAPDAKTTSGRRGVLRWIAPVVMWTNA